VPTRDRAWPEGTPNWVDLAVGDIAAASAFYAELFGWNPVDAGPDAGGYVSCRLDGNPVAGIGPLPFDGAPATWSTYFAVDDVDATTARAAQAGGRALMEPFDVFDLGRMCFAGDPEGATFGLWQAKTHFGVGVYNEPGALVWNDLHTRQFDAAKAFYGELFGFTFDEMHTPELTYASIKRADGEPVAGLSDDSATLPEGAPPYWLAWFGAADVDTVTDKVDQIGGSVLMSPVDFQWGRMSIVTGAQGELFGLVKADAS
jgi:predicted enzyme related to lactoylglutathione lyase